jgi:hypothetical protein
VLKKDERRTGGFFMRLKTDEWFKGYALFTPDPEATRNAGYFEYFEHFDKPNNMYVPCAGMTATCASLVTAPASVR